VSAYAAAWLVSEAGLSLTISESIFLRAVFGKISDMLPLHNE
jgi:hypothetical protein